MNFNVTHLFPAIDRKLIEFLKSLKEDDWNRQTISKLWTVKDAALHLLDGNLRGISAGRDNHISKPNMEIDSNEKLVLYLNELNADWIKAARRISNRLLIELLEITNND